MPLVAKARSSGIYRIRGTVHGVRVDKSAKTRSFERAKEIADAWARQIYEQEVLGKREAQTFAELAVDFLEAGGSLGVKAEEIIIELAPDKCDKITSARLKEVARIIYPDAAPATRNRWIITPISAALHWAADEDRIPFRPYKRFAVPDGPTDWRRPHEIEAIISCMREPESKALMAIYVGGGLRASEPIFLDGRDVAPNLSKVTVLGAPRKDNTHPKLNKHAGSKNRRNRHVDLPPRCRELLSPVIRRMKGPALVNSRGIPWSGRGALRDTLHRACVRADIEPISIHGLRHTFATWHNAVHGDPIRLMALGGWSELSLVERYAHAGDNDLPYEIIRLGWAILGQHDPRQSELPNKYNLVA